MNDKSFFDRIEAAIGNVVSDFSHNPVNYLFESDLQCTLFATLRDNLSDFAFGSKSSDLPELLGYNPTINPVKSEYPYDFEGRTRDRFDVAILDGQQDPSQRIYKQPCRFGIEIKLWYPDGPVGDIWSDVTKLKHYQEFARSRNRDFGGLAILFVFPGAEKRLTAELRSSAGPTISANEVVLHIVTTEKTKVATQSM
jgi:hypothetical protein